MKLIETSLQIALQAYAGKTDKAGREYILHPLRVMAKMKTDLEMSAALLHDVIEDSDITAEQLLAESIPAEVVEAVRYLSKNEH
jgi:(p)ppGpp synthase/HD superfamily hydrolase